MSLLEQLLSASDDYALLNSIADYYHQTLKQTTEARAYLETRGFTGERCDEMIEAFKLGFANRTLGLHLPDKALKDGAHLRSSLQRLGLYRDNGREHLNGSLVIPIIDAANNALNLYGRKITQRLRPGTPLHLHLNQQRGWFNLHGITDQQEIILCDSYFDALTFWYHGFENATAIAGLETFSEIQIAFLKANQTSTVLLTHHSAIAAQRLQITLEEQGIKCAILRTPKGRDINRYVHRIAAPAQHLALLIEDAQGTLSSATFSEPLPSPLRPELPPAAFPDPVDTQERVEEQTEQQAQGPHIDQQGEETFLTFGAETSARTYRVRGLGKNLTVDVLKINLMVKNSDGDFHIDTLDLYQSRPRNSYITQASQETAIAAEVLKHDLGQVLLNLELLQQEQIASALKKPETPAMSAEAREQALALLQSPDLINRIQNDLTACGLIGEDSNKLTIYLAAISRKLQKPLGVLIQSTSAAGKSTLMDAVLAFVPDEDKVQYSAMTGQSLYYMGDNQLKHKVLAIAEEEGAARASYALKLLQSDGALNIASTGKNGKRGGPVTRQYRAEGPVALLLTTTARDIDEELKNRCFVLTVDEGQEQTRAIHEQQRQRRTLEGFTAQQQKHACLQLHQNAQRLLKPLHILNPYAAQLTFPDHSTRLRRDHEKYLTLIDTIALLHQHQRSIKNLERCTSDGKTEILDCIEVVPSDIQLANRLCSEILGRSLDQLPPQTRRLLSLIDDYIQEESQTHNVPKHTIQFSRRQLRETLHWGDTQLKTHLARLVEFEYLTVHKDKQGRYRYEITANIGCETPSLDLTKPQKILDHDANWSGQNSNRSAPGRGAVGGWSAIGRDAKNTTNHRPEPFYEQSRANAPKTSACR